MGHFRYLRNHHYHYPFQYLHCPIHQRPCCICQARPSQTPQQTIIEKLKYSSRRLYLKTASHCTYKGLPFFYLFRARSKRETHRTTYASLLYSRMIAIVQTPYIIKAHELENVFDTDTGFHVRRTPHHAGTNRKSIQPLSRFHRIVLVRQMPPQTPEAKHFPPF